MCTRWCYNNKRVHQISQQAQCLNRDDLFAHIKRVSLSFLSGRIASRMGMVSGVLGCIAPYNYIYPIFFHCSFNEQFPYLSTVVQHVHLAIARLLPFDGSAGTSEAANETFLQIYGSRSRDYSRTTGGIWEPDQVNTQICRLGAYTAKRT